MADIKQSQQKITSFALSSQNDTDSSSGNESKSAKKQSKLNSTEKNSSSSENDLKIPQNKHAQNGEVNGSTLQYSWTLEEDEMLLQNVGQYLATTNKPAKSRGVLVKDIDWKDVAPSGDHTPEDAKDRFTKLSSRVRKIRTALEIVNEMKEHLAKGGILDHTRAALKRKAPKVDPDLPKKPMSSYMRYFHDKKLKLLEKHPDLTFGDVGRKMGKKWRKLSVEKKEKYINQFHADMEEYNHKMVVYLQRHHHHPDVEPPKTAFELWSKKEEKKIKKEKPEISEKKLKKKLNRRWENMEDSEKTKWNDTQRTGVKKYRKKIAQVERKKQKNTLIC